MYSSERELIDRLRRQSAEVHEKTFAKKKASVIGRGIAGTVIAGPVGGIIGAISAVDKNMKNKK